MDRTASVSYLIYMVLIMLEMHAAEPLVFECSYFGVEITIEKLKRYKS
jgi:hypothetical protein